MWLGFNLTAISLAGFGFFFCWTVVSYAIYGILVWNRDEVFIMKDRLATVAIWTGAVIALVALLAVVFYVVAKGAPVGFASFPQFLVNDMTGGKSGDADGVGVAIVGTLEQVAIATMISVPIAFLTATYMVESQSALARLVRNIVEADHRHPVHHRRPLHLHHLGRPPRCERKIRLRRCRHPVDHDDFGHLPSRFEVIRVVPGSLREAALAIGAPQWRVALRVVLPTARAGLITAAILGVALTAGETAEVLFTAG